jgi:RsmE family RNA methyltransferase
MNLLLLEPSEMGEDDRVTLTGRRAEHLRSVLGVVPGSEVRAAVLGTGVSRAEVVAVDASAVTLQLGEPAPLPALPRLSLILALPRPRALARILRLGASLGLERIDLINSWRVEKSYFSSPVVTPEALRRELWLGAEQGGWPRLPEIAVHPKFRAFLEPLAPPPGTRALLADPEAAAPIEEVVLADPREPAAEVLAIGPEGGWIERERESFRDHGFAEVRLGPWVLTVEHAVAVALGQWELLRRMSRT